VPAPELTADRAEIGADDGVVSALVEAVDADLDANPDRDGVDPWEAGFTPVPEAVELPRGGRFCAATVAERTASDWVNDAAVVLACSWRSTMAVGGALDCVGTFGR
jgi:hypothetical protein